jgi:hypothetical protein
VAGSLKSDVAPNPRASCRECGAVAYRPVIARDAAGRLTASGLYQCTGCRLRFKHLNEWREVQGHTPKSNASSADCGI